VNARDPWIVGGVFDLGLSAVLAAFGTSNELIEISQMPVRAFDVRLIGVRARVRTSQGFHVPAQPRGEWRPECVVVPAIGYKMPGPLEKALARPDVRDAAAALREWNALGALMSTACIGTFVMAELPWRREGDRSAGKHPMAFRGGHRPSRTEPGRQPCEQLQKSTTIVPGADSLPAVSTAMMLMVVSP
jgi:hypothetical protein